MILFFLCFIYRISPSISFWVFNLMWALCCISSKAGHLVGMCVCVREWSCVNVSVIIIVFFCVYMWLVVDGNKNLMPFCGSGFWQITHKNHQFENGFFVCRTIKIKTVTTHTIKKPTEQHLFVSECFKNSFRMNELFRWYDFKETPTRIKKQQVNNSVLQWERENRRTAAKARQRPK